MYVSLNSFRYIYMFSQNEKSFVPKKDSQTLLRDQTNCLFYILSGLFLLGILRIYYNSIETGTHRETFIQ